MAAPSYLKSVAVVEATQQARELQLKLYMYEYFPSSLLQNEVIMVNNPDPPHFGKMTVIDFGVFRSTEQLDVQPVAHAHGTILAAGKNRDHRFISFNLVFAADDRRDFYTGDEHSPPSYGEWAIVGGTGKFTYAQGVVKFEKLNRQGFDGRIWTLDIRALCRSFINPPKQRDPNEGAKPKPIPPAPVITQGALHGHHEKGKLFQPEKPPYRLLAIKIYSGMVIDALGFTYHDQAGHMHKVIWGNPSGGNKHKITLEDGEGVKEIRWSTGDISSGYGEHKVIQTLRFVTSRKTTQTYGNYGKKPALGKIHSIPATNGGSIVGFLVRSDGLFINAVGA